MVFAVVAFSRPAVAHPSYSFCDQVRDALGTLRSAVKLYEIDHDGHLPADLRVLKSSGVLDQAASLLDPWGSPYVLLANGDDFEVVTIGPDHVRGTRDDFSSSSPSPCPSWPSARSNRWLALLVFTAAIAGISSLLALLSRRRPKRLPRTTLN